jgi:hypothetical protein
VLGLLGIALPWWSRWAALALLAAACAGWGAMAMHKHDGVRYEALAREFAAFRAKEAAEGEAARQRALLQTSNDLKAKEKADADLKAARAAAAVAADGWLRLAASRAGGGYLPPAAATTGGADRGVCLARAEFERIMGELDREGARLAAAGDNCAVDLAAARRWAAGQEKRD